MTARSFHTAAHVAVVRTTAPRVDDTPAPTDFEYTADYTWAPGVREKVKKG